MTAGDMSALQQELDAGVLASIGQISYEFSDRARLNGRWITEGLFAAVWSHPAVAVVLQKMQRAGGQEARARLQRRCRRFVRHVLISNGYEKADFSSRFFLERREAPVNESEEAARERSAERADDGSAPGGWRVPLSSMRLIQCVGGCCEPGGVMSLIRSAL